MIWPMMITFVWGLCIGIGVAGGVRQILSDWNRTRLAMKQLEREIAADKLQEARELHRSRQLEIIRMNEEQGNVEKSEPE
jgi:Tfp pilus assembly protein PilN